MGMYQQSGAMTDCTKLTLLWTQFAIRTSIRNHTVLTRDLVIRQVAEAVGGPHTVDLTKYELLILVDIYKVCYARRPRMP